MQVTGPSCIVLPSPSEGRMARPLVSYCCQYFSTLQRCFLSQQGHTTCIRETGLQNQFAISNDHNFAHQHASAHALSRSSCPKFSSSGHLSQLSSCPKLLCACTPCTICCPVLKLHQAMPFPPLPTLQSPPLGPPLPAFPPPPHLLPPGIPQSPS